MADRMALETDRTRVFSPVWVVFLIGAAISALAWAVADSRSNQHARAKADIAIQDAAKAIQARLHGKIDVLYGLHGFFRASGSVDRLEFERYVSSLELGERHPAIKALTYAPIVEGKDREAFVGAVRADETVHATGFAHYDIRPAGTRDEHLPIVYAEPFARNQRGLGIDLLVGERADAAELARDTGQPITSKRLSLPSHPTEPAFAVRMAVYRNGARPATQHERRAAFVGVVSAVFLARTLVEDILMEPALAPMRVKLYDRRVITGAEALGAQPVEYVFFEKPAETPYVSGSRRYIERNLSLDVGGHHWYLAFAGSADGFVTPTDRLLPWLLLVVGLAITALLAGLVRSIASSSARAQRLAERITEDLRHSEAQLAEAQRLTQAMIEALPNPIFFKDPEGRYRGVNKAWERFFGRERTTFLGKTVHDLYPHDQRTADSLHAQDLALWRNPGSQVHEANIPNGRGDRRDVVYYKATYARADGQIAGLIGTIIDMSERKQAERRQQMEHAVTRVLAEADSIGAAIPAIIKTICEAMGWHYGDRYEFNAESGMLERREWWTIDTPELQRFATSSENRSVSAGDLRNVGLIRRCFGTGKPVWIADIAADDQLRRRDLVIDAGLHGAFAFPLTSGGQVLGVIEFFNRDVLQPDAMLLQIAESIGSQIGQFMVRMQAEEAVKFVAMHDGLTQLPNRVMFNARLEQALAQAHRQKRALAVMFIDLDRFKIINDTLGHEAGDHLLREVAQRISEHLRSGDMVARLGGDEFVLLVENDVEPEALATIAEKLIASLTESFLISEREVHVSASIGISTYPTDARDMRSLLKFADIAMYRAKEQGRNTYQFYSDRINVHSVERLTLESRLRGALERDELVLHYQPVLDLKTNQIVAMEALVRWQHGADLLPPGRFISIAEETGLIVAIGSWIMETACAQQRKWVDEGLPAMRIAVNLSPRQFAHRNLVEDIVGILARTGCDPELLELEITESVVMHNAAQTEDLLTRLKSMGIRLAIDDFGTGYSSLAYLKRFPIDCLKIDRSFVSDIPGDSSDTAITQAIVAMAHSLDLRVVGEGVESAEQLACLRAQGCDEVQGYYLSRPLPEPAAGRFVEQALARAGARNVTPLEPSRRRAVDA